VPDTGTAMTLWIAPTREPARVLVRRAGEPVGLLVHADVAAYFEPDPVQFAPRDLLDFEASSLRAIEVERGGVTEKAERGASLADWSLSAPLVMPVDPDALAGLRDAAAHLHAARAVAASPAGAHGLAHPRLLLTFVLDPPPTKSDAPPERRTLALGALTPQQECYARVAGDAAAPVYLLDAETCATLATPLASREVWPERDALAVELPGARYERNGPGWYGPDAVRLPERAAAAIGTALRALGAPATVLGYGTPAAPTRLTVSWADGSKSVLLMGKGDYALEGRAVRYALPKEACEAFTRLCK
jgi:Domain of unknown function (DUF4340)